ncbi:hypothetical protein GQ457_09G011320 [Hibiscus cannabinus]
MLDFFEQLKMGINSVLVVLVETFISLNACRELEGVRFKGCAHLLQVWALNLNDEEIVWRVPWLGRAIVLYKCGDYDWLMLIGV